MKIKKLIISIFFHYSFIYSCEPLINTSTKFLNFNEKDKIIHEYQCIFLDYLISNFNTKLSSKPLKESDYNQLSEKRKECFREHGVLRYQLIKTLLHNKIDLSEYPNLIKSLEDILFRKLVRIKLKNAQKLTIKDFFRNSNLLTGNTESPPEFLKEIIKQNNELLNQKITLKNFNYLGRSTFTTIIKKPNEKSKLINNHEVIVTIRPTNDYILIPGTTPYHNLVDLTVREFLPCCIGISCIIAVGAASSIAWVINSLT